MPPESEVLAGIRLALGSLIIGGAALALIVLAPVSI